MRLEGVSGALCAPRKRLGRVFRTPEVSKAMILQWVLACLNEVAVTTRIATQAALADDVKVWKQLGIVFGEPRAILGLQVMSRVRRGCVWGACGCATRGSTPKLMLRRPISLRFSQTYLDYTPPLWHHPS